MRTRMVCNARPGTVTRGSVVARSDKGMPLYADANESDIFIFSGHEDLVPVLTEDPDGRDRAPGQDGEYRIDAYRPRVEDVFARIERRTHIVTGDTHWRSIMPDNVTSVYGLSTGARIADPRNPLHVFKWLLEATFDPLGNITFYCQSVRKRGSDAILVVLRPLQLRCPDKAGPQQVQVGSPIHLPLDQFELCVLPFGLAV